MRNWWDHNLTMTDRTNIVCFVFLLMFSVMIGIISKKIWKKKWTASFIWILLIDFCGLILLIVRLLF